MSTAISQLVADLKLLDETTPVRVSHDDSPNGDNMWRITVEQLPTIHIYFNANSPDHTFFVECYIGDLIVVTSNDLSNDLTGRLWALIGRWTRRG